MSNKIVLTEDNSVPLRTLPTQELKHTDASTKWSVLKNASKDWGTDLGKDVAKSVVASLLIAGITAVAKGIFSREGKR